MRLYSKCDLNTISPLLAKAVFKMEKAIKSFAFIDLETTGLPREKYCKITEISLTIVHAEYLSLGVNLRVLNKINLCINPLHEINPIAANITGLNNINLQEQSTFSDKTVTMINNFFDLSQKPICLVAHNGNKFDYPILRQEIHNTGMSLDEDLLCIDSLQFFRDLKKNDSTATNLHSDVSSNEYFEDGFDELLCNAVDEYEKSTKSELSFISESQKRNETTPVKNKIPFKLKEKINNHVNRGKPRSLKLGDLYTYFTSKAPIQAHNAEKDVEMLLECAANCGLPFTEWANKNCIKFNTIPRLDSTDFRKTL